MMRLGVALLSLWLFLSPALADGLSVPGAPHIGLSNAAFSFPPSSGGASLSCSYTPVTTGTQGTAYTGATPSASGGTPSYTFSETGTLPGGLSISSSTGVISGTPTASGSFPSIQVGVTDSLTNTANCGSAFTLVISPTYTGPGDLSVSYSAYYGLRAYSAATRGNKLVNVCDASDIHCGDLFSDATTGKLTNLVMSGGSGVNCGSVACTIKTYYDLTGGNQCTSLSCDATQATIASRDTLGTSCTPLSVSVCATSTGGRYITANNISIAAAPVFMSGVVSVTDTGNEQVAMGNNGGTSQIFYWRTGGAHEAGVTGNGQSTILWSGAYTNGYHSLAGLANTASSYIVLDSAVTTGSAAVNTSQIGAINIHGDGFSDNLAVGGIFLEGGMALTAPASATAQSINANAKTFWGF